MYNNSVMLFTTDNGGELPYAPELGPGGGAGSNYPLRGGKFSLWEGGVRGLAFIHSPLLPWAQCGSSYTDLVHVIDIYPTLAGLAGVNASTFSTGPYPLDGIDLSASLWGDGAARRRHEILHQPLGKYWDGNCSAGDLANKFRPSCGAGITRWPYKLLFGYAGDNRSLPNPDGFYRALSIGAGEVGGYHELSVGQAGVPVHVLGEVVAGVPAPAGAPCVARPCVFNVETDPNELQNIADSHPDVVKELMAALWAYGDTGADPQPGGDDTEPTDAQCASVTSSGSWKPGWGSEPDVIM